MIRRIEPESLLSRMEEILDNTAGKGAKVAVGDVPKEFHIKDGLLNWILYPNGKSSLSEEARASALKKYDELKARIYVPEGISSSPRRLGGHHKTTYAGVPVSR